MHFSPQFLDALRSRVQISEVVGRRVRLQRKGKEYLGLCPFHNEKTPSFTVNDEKGFYHCFGCGAHGDAVRFTMETTGMGYVEAITRLAEEVGLPLPVVSKEEQRHYERTAVIYEALELACSFYKKNLAYPVGEPARNYIRQRGLSGEMVALFRLGYAPATRTALKSFLQSKGVPERVMKAAGLLAEKDGATYDRFRNRLIFPITDSRNRVIAFGGRILGEGLPKYLNSPETELFRKGEVLYAFPQARQAIHDAGTVVVTEGYMDVIALHGAGIAYAVAPLGTAITERHLALLWRMAKEPVLCLDGDTAGKKAMLRVAEMSIKFLKPGVSLRFCMLPAKMDPDDVIRKQGAGAMQQMIASAMPLSEVLWEDCLLQVPGKTPEHRAELETRVMDYVAMIKDARVQSYYRRFFQERLWELNRGTRYAAKPSGSGNGQEKHLRGIRLSGDVSPILRHEYVLIGLVLKYPELLDNPLIEEEFSHIEFSSEILDNMRVATLEVRNFAPLLKEGGNDGVQQMVVRGFEKEAGSALRELEQVECLPGRQSDVPLMWEQSVIAHQLAMVEQEYAGKLLEMTEEAEVKAQGLRKEIDTLKEKLSILLLQ